MFWPEAELKSYELNRDAECQVSGLRYRVLGQSNAFSAIGLGLACIDEIHNTANNTALISLFAVAALVVGNPCAAVLWDIGEPTHRLFTLNLLLPHQRGLDGSQKSL